jgi:hypothetical protein
MIFRLHDAEGLQLGTHGLIDLRARGIVGRNDDGVVRAGGVAPGNRRDALLGSAISVTRPCCSKGAMPSATSPRDKCSTARSSSGSFWRTIWSSCAVFIPA